MVDVDKDLFGEFLYVVRQYAEKSHRDLWPVGEKATKWIAEEFYRQFPTKKLSVGAVDKRLLRLRRKRYRGLPYAYQREQEWFLGVEWIATEQPTAAVLWSFDCLCTKAGGAIDKDALVQFCVERLEIPPGDVKKIVARQMDKEVQYLEPRKDHVNRETLRLGKRAVLERRYIELLCGDEWKQKIEGALESQQDLRPSARMSSIPPEVVRRPERLKKKAGPQARP